MDKLAQLKKNILEEQAPFFSEEDLAYYLEKNKGNVRDASYECLILKSESMGLDVSGLSTKDTSEYFKMLASQYVGSRNRRI